MSEAGLVTILTREDKEQDIDRIRLNSMLDQSSLFRKQALYKGIQGLLYATLMAGGAEMMIYDRPLAFIGGFAFLVGSFGIETIDEAIEDFRYHRAIRADIQEAIRKGRVTIDVPTTDYKIV